MPAPVFSHVKYYVRGAMPRSACRTLQAERKVAWSRFQLNAGAMFIGSTATLHC